jgi:putative methionine-R-sulfoxide reductase with GAF domain
MQMTQTINGRFNLNVMLAVLFIVGIGASFYFIYSLPSSLNLAFGFQSQFLLVYVVVSATFIVGILALIFAMRYKREIVIFRDKIIDTTEVKRESEQAGKTTISLDSVKSALATAEKKAAVQDSLHTICKQLEAGQGAFYVAKEENNIRVVELHSGYALNIGESKVLRYEFGEGLVGQVAATGNPLYIDDVPEGYITILSGLGNASPKFLLLIPVKAKEKVVGVIELASFTRVTDDQKKFVEESAQLIGEKIL